MGRFELQRLEPSAHRVDHHHPVVAGVGHDQAAVGQHVEAARLQQAAEVGPVGSTRTVRSLLRCQAQSREL